MQDPAAFRTGRDLAAWIGITPRANSSGGKERLGRISKRGNKQLRTQLIVGATSILKQARRGVKLSAWIVSSIARRPYKVAAVALANKIARTIHAPLCQLIVACESDCKGRGRVRNNSSARCLALAWAAVEACRIAGVHLDDLQVPTSVPRRLVRPIPQLLRRRVQLPDPVQM